MIVIYNLMSNNKGKVGLILIVLVSMILMKETLSQSRLAELLPEINAALEKGKQNIWDEIEPDEPLWNFPPWLGTLFISEYYFELKGTK